jgi:valyl-tRNA synthetase
MPFITEELWHVLRAQVKAEAWPDSIMAGRYPAVGPVDQASDAAFSPVLGIIDALRNLRGEMGIPFKVALGQALPVHVAVTDPAVYALLTAGEEKRVARLAGVEKLSVHLAAATPHAPQSAVAVGVGFEVRVPLAGVIDLAAETARIDKELAKVAADLTLMEKKLSNPSFVERAPAEVVAKDRARVEELREATQKLTNHRAMMSGATNQREEAPMETTPPNAAPATPTTVEKAEQAAAAVVAQVEAKGQEAVAAVQAEVKVVKAKAKQAMAKGKKAVKKAVKQVKTQAKKVEAKVKKAVKKATARKPAKKAPAKKAAAKKAPAKKAAKKAKKK